LAHVRTMEKRILTVAGGAAGSWEVMGVDAGGAVGGAALEGAVLAVALHAPVLAPPGLSVAQVVAALRQTPVRRPRARTVAH